MCVVEERDLIEARSEVGQLQHANTTLSTERARLLGALEDCESREEQAGNLFVAAKKTWNKDLQTVKKELREVRLFFL